MIQKLKLQDIDEVAKLHTQELSGFLPELGIGFLRVFYKATLSTAEIFTFVAKENDHICGFVSGISHTKGLYRKILLTDIFGFGSLLIHHFITHPHHFLTGIKLFTYPGFSQDGPELLTIAIGRKWQGRGWGRKLFQKVIQEFRKRGISYFRISVYDRLAANGFYKKMGCRKETSFAFLGEKMNYYKYEIEN